jgi:hypothetical protein
VLYYNLGERILSFKYDNEIVQITVKNKVPIHNGFVNILFEEGKYKVV